MKILLIQPPWYGFQNIVSQRLYLGLAYIAAVLDKEGHEVKIFNGETFFKDIKNIGETVKIDEESYRKNFSKEHPVYKDIMDELKEFEPDVVGISFMTANSTSAYILSELIKEYSPKIPLIAGGVHPTLLPDEPFKRGKFDFVVRGEGEETIKELIKNIDKTPPTSGHLLLNEGEVNIPGISYIKNGEVVHNPSRPFIQNLDSIPFPAFHLMHEAEKYPYSSTGITTTRGCPFECNYCASKLLWTRKVRFRSPENVLDEMRDRHEKLGVKRFSLQDDTFTVNPQFVKDICNGILKFDFKISWACDTRGDTLNLELLKLMKKAGCRHIYLGLETGSPAIMEFIKKRTTVEKVRKAVELAKKAGVESTVYFMVGFPDETEEDIKMSLEAMKKINADHTIWSILTPYPGTEIWDIAESRGLLNKDVDWSSFFHHYNQGDLFKSISDDKWAQMIERIESEQKKQNEKITWVKLKRKFAGYWYLIKLAVKRPEKIINRIIRIYK